MSLPGRAGTLVKPIIAFYSQNQALANLRQTSSATHAGCSWLEEMHWLVETDSGCEVPEILKSICEANLDFDQVPMHWDQWVRLIASVYGGHTSAVTLWLRRARRSAV